METLRTGCPKSPTLAHLALPAVWVGSIPPAQGMSPFGVPFSVAQEVVGALLAMGAPRGWTGGQGVRGSILLWVGLLCVWLCPWQQLHGPKPGCGSQEAQYRGKIGATGCCKGKMGLGEQL